MRSQVAFGIVLMACGPGTGVSEPHLPQAAATDSAKPKVAETKVAETNVAATPWDPNTPVDSSKLRLQTLFVVAKSSAICPTREQAVARECGHSVESRSQGVRVGFGSAVSVVEEQPVNGFYKALRYQKTGVLPSWIAADDLAHVPELPFLQQWDSLPDVAKAQDATSKPARGLLSLPAGALVKWPRTRALKYGTFQDKVFLYLEFDGAGGAAIEMPAPSEQNSYVENHACLIEGDCTTLSYICDSGYCDEVSILARATGRSVPPPQAASRVNGSSLLPLFAGLALADRYGLFLNKGGKH